MKINFLTIQSSNYDQTTKEVDSPAKTLYNTVLENEDNGITMTLLQCYPENVISVVEDYGAETIVPWGLWCPHCPLSR